MVAGAVRRLEAFHNVSVSNGAIEEAVRKVNSLNTKLRLQGSAVQILDETFTMVRIRHDRACSPDAELRQIRQLIKAAIDEASLQKQAELVDTEARLLKAVSSCKEDLALHPPRVSAEHVAEILMRWDLYSWIAIESIDIACYGISP